MKRLLSQALQTFAFLCGGWMGQAIADNQANSRRCGNDVGVVQNFWLGRKSLLVGEILILRYLEANNTTTTTVTNRVKILKEKFTQSLGLPFEELLSESAIEQVMDELKIKYRRRLFDPIVTLWAFLSQVLDVDKSCHNATSRVITYLVGESQEIPSTELHLAQKIKI